MSIKAFTAVFVTGKLTFNVHKTESVLASKMEDSGWWEWQVHRAWEK